MKWGQNSSSEAAEKAGYTASVKPVSLQNEKLKLTRSSSRFSMACTVFSKALGSSTSSASTKVM